jgi:hypothetical protein
MLLFSFRMALLWSNNMILILLFVKMCWSHFTVPKIYALIGVHVSKIHDPKSTDFEKLTITYG